MALSYDFLVARADEAASEAANARLDNVRDRALRSEAAWRDMAAREKRLQKDRADRVVERQRELARVAEEEAALESR
jgi:hypothetical protein